jgi:hypothetical protein
MNGLRTTRCLENGLDGEVGAVNVQHSLLEDEMLSPQIEQIGLESAARRSEIVQPGHTAVRLKGRHKVHSPHDEVIELLLAHFPQ